MKTKPNLHIKSSRRDHFMAIQPFPRPLSDRLRQLAGHSDTQYPDGYELIYSSRRTLAVQITSGGQVRVRAPRRTSKAAVERFLIEKQEWILKHLTKAAAQAAPPPPPLPESERRRYMETARDIFTQKAAYYASIMRVTYGRISIREQKTRWGSCSSRKNLNFNYKLAYMPQEIMDYVVVHELAHLQHMNHSQEFWQLVEQYIPDYKERRKWLKEHGKEY